MSNLSNQLCIGGNWRGAHSPQPSNHEVLLSYNTPLNGLAGPRSFIMLGGLVSSTSASSELYNLYRATTLERSRMRSIQPPHSTLFCFRLRDLLSTNVWSIVHLSRRTDIICHSFRLGYKDLHLMHLTPRELELPQCRYPNCKIVQLHDPRYFLQREAYVSHDFCNLP